MQKKNFSSFTMKCQKGANVKCHHARSKTLEIQTKLIVKSVLEGLTLWRCVRCIPWLFSIHFITEFHGNFSRGWWIASLVETFFRSCIWIFFIFFMFFLNFNFFAWSHSTLHKSRASAVLSFKLFSIAIVVIVIVIIRGNSSSSSIIRIIRYLLIYYHLPRDSMCTQVLFFLCLCWDFGCIIIFMHRYIFGSLVRSLSLSLFLFLGALAFEWACNAFCLPMDYIIFLYRIHFYSCVSDSFFPFSSIPAALFLFLSHFHTQFFDVNEYI